jgi:hypothetical protein
MEKRTTTRTQIETFGLISKGFKFEVTHIDGYKAKETVSSISKYFEETEELQGKGFSSFYAIGRKTTIIVICESCCSYTIEDLERLKVKVN